MPVWITHTYGGRKPGFHFKPGRFPIKDDDEYWFKIWYQQELESCSWKTFAKKVLSLAHDLGASLEEFYSSNRKFKSNRPSMQSNERHQLAALVEAKFPRLGDKYDEFSRRHYLNSENFGIEVSASTFEWPTFTVSGLLLSEYFLIPIFYIRRFLIAS